MKSGPGQRGEQTDAQSETTEHEGSIVISAQNNTTGIQIDTSPQQKTKRKKAVAPRRPTKKAKQGE